MLSRARLGLIGALLLTGVARAEERAYTWTAPPPSVQLHADQTPIPAGQGALFIPTISGAASEPDVLIVNGDQVIVAAVGQRTPLPPGRYVVLVGSADPSIATGVPVAVAAGQTTLVPVQWGALRIEVVDKNLVRHDGPFVLTHAETGQVVEIPARIDKTGVSTWLLKPGLYRVTEPGSERMTAPDFTTVHVPASGLVNLRLFMDRRTGDFRGAGVVPLSQTLPEEDENLNKWVGSLVFSAEGSAAQSQHIVGLPDTTNYTGAVVFDGQLDYLGDFQGLSLTGRLEEGQQILELLDEHPLPRLKSRDRLAGQALYSLNLNDGIGAYGRAAASTQLLDTFIVATEDTELAIRRQDGDVSYQALTAGDTFTIADGLSPTIIKLGAGLNTRIFSWRSLRLSVRGGPAIRYNLFDGAMVSEDNPLTDALEYTRISSFEQRGLEASADLTAQITGWATLSGQLDTFVEWGDYTTPVIELEGGLNIRLSRIFSLNYNATAAKNPFVTSELSLQHGGFLRASWSLL